MSSDDAFAPGVMLGKYEVLATIGKGGMAQVMLARQRGLGGFERPVVIKVIHPHMAHDAAAINMLLDEARLAAQIVHHNVVQTYELDEAHGTFYIVMEYLAGESLAQVLQRAVGHKMYMPPRHAAHLIASVCEGLHAAHEVVIHRDISPGNLVVLYSGAVKIVDFGIAKANGRLTRTADGSLKGKYGYMPPEQILNEPVDQRSDLFSLGVVLWETLTHRRLFQAETVTATLMQILHAPRIPPSQHNPQIPPALDAIVLKALAVDPRDRFQSADEMRRALHELTWTSRSGSAEISEYMTELFADRIAQRRALLARTRHDDPRILEILATLEDSSEPRSERVAAVAVPAPRARTSKRGVIGWLATSVLAAGVLAATVGYQDEHDDLAPRVAIAQPAARIEPAPAVVPAPDRVAEPELAPEPVVERTVVEVTRSRTPRPRGESRIATPDVAAPSTDADGPITSTTDTRMTATAEVVAPAPVITDETVSVAAIDATYRRATADCLAGRFAEAVSGFAEVVALDPQRAAAYRGLGIAYQRSGRNRRAIAAYRSFLALRPDATDADAIRARIESLESSPVGAIASTAPPGQ